MDCPKTKVYLNKFSRIINQTRKSYIPISLSSFLLKKLNRLIDIDNILETNPLQVRKVISPNAKRSKKATCKINKYSLLKEKMF